MNNRAETAAFHEEMIRRVGSLYGQAQVAQLLAATPSSRRNPSFGNQSADWQQYA